MASVSGTVRDAVTGDPVAFQMLKIFDLDDPLYFPAPPYPPGILDCWDLVTTDALGEYRFSYVEEHRFLLSCVDYGGSAAHYPKWYNNKDEIGAADVLLITEDTVTGIDFEVTPGAGPLSGTVINAPPGVDDMLTLICERRRPLDPMWLWIISEPPGAWFAYSAFNPAVPYKIIFMAFGPGLTLLDHGWFCNKDSTAVDCADNAYGGESNLDHDFDVASPCPEATKPYCSHLVDTSGKAGSLVQRRCRRV